MRFLHCMSRAAKLFAGAPVVRGIEVYEFQKKEEMNEIKKRRRECCGLKERTWAESSYRDNRHIWNTDPEENEALTREMNATIPGGWPIVTAAEFQKGARKKRLQFLICPCQWLVVIRIVLRGIFSRKRNCSGCWRCRISIVPP